MKKRILIVFIIVATGFAAVLIKRGTGSHDDGTLLLSGNIEITESNLGFKIAGRIMQLLAEEGQRVKKGDRLAVLDSSELEGIVSQNKARLNEALVRLDEMRAGARHQEVEQVKANLTAAEAEMDKAAKDYERAEALYKKGLVSAQEVDTALKGRDVTVSQHQKARQALSLINEGARKEDIQAAREVAQQAIAALNVSEERLKDTVLYAPVTGVVLRKNMELGETSAPGMPVYTVGDLENPWVKVYVKEDKLGLLKLGNRAGITVDSYPGKIYEGKVTYLSSEAEFTPKSVQTQEERVKLVFGVKVSVKNINDELKPGMPADVRIKLQ